MITYKLLLLTNGEGMLSLKVEEACSFLIYSPFLFQ